MRLKRAGGLIGLLLASLALGAPTVAQGDVLITDEDGALEQGALVRLASADLRFTTAGGTLECSEVGFHFELLTNGASHVELLQLGAAESSGCLLNRHALEVEPFTLPFVFTDWTASVGEDSVITIDTWGSASTAMTFVADIAGVLTCHFEGLAELETGHPSPNAQLSLTPSVLSGGSPGCAPSVTAHATFAMETTDGGAPVYLQFDETTA